MAKETQEPPLLFNQNSDFFTWDLQSKLWLLIQFAAFNSVAFYGSLKSV
jgi:hypothetical protein